MRLEPLYRVQFTTAEARNVELSGEHGVEGRSDDRYRWLNGVFGAVNGEVRPRADGRLDVVLEVGELVWEPL